MNAKQTICALSQHPQHKAHAKLIISRFEVHRVSRHFILEIMAEYSYIKYIENPACVEIRIPAYQRLIYIFSFLHVEPFVENGGGQLPLSITGFTHSNIHNTRYFILSVPIRFCNSISCSDNYICFYLRFFD